jgi:hypothetical protein
VNFKGIAKTKEGTPFSFYYTGIVKINEEIGKIFQYSPEAKTIPFGQSSKFPSLPHSSLYHSPSVSAVFPFPTFPVSKMKHKVTLTTISATYHTFETGAPELKDLENTHWMGNGRFVLSETGLTVESRVSKVVASTVMDYPATVNP